MRPQKNPPIISSAWSLSEALEIFEYGSQGKQDKAGHYQPQGLAAKAREDALACQNTQHGQGHGDPKGNDFRGTEFKVHMIILL